MIRLFPTNIVRQRLGTRRCSRMLSVGFVTALALSGSVQAQESSIEKPSTPTTAAQVVEKLEPRDQVLFAFHSLLPNAASRDLADRLVEEYPEVWADFDAEYAELLSETFSEAQLVELLTFLSSDTGELWIRSSASLMEKMQSGSNDPGSLTFRMAAIGCAIGVLSPGDVEITDETYEATRTSREAAVETCDCLLTKVVEKWPSVPIARKLLEPEAQSYFGELFSAGACPLPVAGS